MKRSVIRYLIGKILLVEAILLLLPILIGFLYQESWRQIGSYLVVAIRLGVVGAYLSRERTVPHAVRARDGIIVVALGWILLSFFGALPLVLSGEIPSTIDAVFEIASGFTTTGSTILSDLSILSHSSLFW